MKFLCDRCKTRYSIGDDRVRGKILKIRCKNCANVITVREGMSDDAASLGPRSKKPTTLAPTTDLGASSSSSALGQAFASAMTKPPPALEEEWYVSIDGDQSGPFSLAEAQRWVSAKPVDAELHCWSEGFDDWLPVDKVSHFRNLRKKSPSAAPPPLPRIGGGAAPRPGAGVQPQEEPRPLFAATMASLEKAHAPADTARGVAALGNGTGGGANAMTARPAVGPAGPGTKPMGPSIPNGARGNGGARGAKPIFDTDGDDGATKIEPLPFTEEAMTAAEPVAAAARQQSNDAFSKALHNRASDDAATTTPHMNAAATTPHMNTMNGPGSSMSSGSMGSMGGPMGNTSSKPMPAMGGPMQPAPSMGNQVPLSALGGGPSSVPDPRKVEDGAVEGDGLDIGEVSRVVKLADIVRGAAPRNNANQAMRRSNPALGQAGRITNPANRIAGTGPAVAITTPGVNPDQLIGPDGLPVEMPIADEMHPDQQLAIANPAISHKRGMIMLIAGAVALIGILLVVVLVVTNNDDDGPVFVAQYTEIDTTGREFIIKEMADGTKVTVDKRTGEVVTNARTFRPGTSQVKIPQKPPEQPTGDPLGGNDVEAMAKKTAPQTASCWMRSRRGAEDIVLSDVKKVTVVLTIGKDGIVSNVIYKGLPPGTKLEGCLTGMIKSQWKFRSPNPGATLGFTMVPPQ